MTIAVVYSDGIREYDFGPGHPFRGDRYATFIRLLHERLTDDDFELVEPRYANDDELLLVHDQLYIDFLEGASKGVWLPSYRFLSPDTPLQPGIARAARLIAGTSLTATEIVWEGKFSRAVSVGGGMHHARKRFGAGFCIYNDVAISVRNLIEKYNLERVLILDTDAHAGDGTCELFYQDPRVLFIDLHQDPRTLYPGTGFAHDIGAGEGKGFTVNVPLPPGASDAAYEYVMDQIFQPLAEEFQPQMIIRNGGADPHFADELTNLGLTLEGFRMLGAKVAQVADELCQGRAVDLVGSGYNQRVLPYGWLALMSGLAGLDIELREPFLFSLKKDYQLDETKRVVEQVRQNLKDYWRCFR
ncbi:MAG: histone deacetylase [Chloroflexi bacterium]|nr:MAG: histone deacetylase [Chloroflexota bacterium]